MATPNPLEPVKGAGTTLWVYNGKGDAYANPLSDDDWQRLAKVKDLTPGEMTAEPYDDNYLDDSIGKAVTAKEVITRTVKVTNVGKPSVAEERSEITPATAIKVTPTSGTVAKGKTTTLTVSFEPESATDKTFRAVSADPSKATISVKDMTITVNGVATGKVQIPVVSGNGQFAAVAEVTVTEAGAAG
ncbi:Ig domain-containing protein, partial [Escherichia coli]|nr:Ig domain-containing protein [Escherichia coli]